MLEMRPNCENCDRDLAPESFEARICSFECTFCDRCADHILGGICPNCTGELLPRPARPCWLLEGAPGAELRTNSEVDVDAHRISPSTTRAPPASPGSTPDETQLSG